MVHDQNGRAGQLWSLNNLSMASSVWKSDFKGNDGGFSYKDELSQRTQETEERSCSLLETKLFLLEGGRSTFSLEIILSTAQKNLGSLLSNCWI